MKAKKERVIPSGFWRIDNSIHFVILFLFPSLIFYADEAEVFNERKENKREWSFLSIYRWKQQPVSGITRPRFVHILDLPPDFSILQQQSQPLAKRKENDKIRRAHILVAEKKVPRVYRVVVTSTYNKSTR